MRDEEKRARRREYYRRYRKQHREKLRAQRRARYEKKRAKCIEQSAKYCRKHPERRAEYIRRYRAEHAGIWAAAAIAEIAQHSQRYKAEIVSALVGATWLLAIAIFAGIGA